MGAHYGLPPRCLGSSVPRGTLCSDGFSLAPRAPLNHPVWPPILAHCPPPSALARTPMSVAGGEDTSLFSWLLDYLEGMDFLSGSLRTVCLSGSITQGGQGFVCVYYNVLEGCTIHCLLHLHRHKVWSAVFVFLGDGARCEGQGEGLKGRCEGLQRGDGRVETWP